jgi:hypothetical protein
MKTFGCLALLAAAVLAVGLVAAEAKDQKDAKGGASQLDALKRLAGDWTGKMKHGEEEHEATVSYKVTSGGSAVMETLGAGTEHEMVTVYCQDGDDLVLTHYCMLGNQPHMRAERGGAADKLAFKFTGCGNLKSDKDPHMHDVTFEFLGDDHVKATWTLYKDGKPAETATFDMKRKGK